MKDAFMGRCYTGQQIARNPNELAKVVLREEVKVSEKARGTAAKVAMVAREVRQAI